LDVKTGTPGRFALRSVAAAALCVLATQSWALGLGRLQVQSALGEALRAEIDVTSLTPEEASTLQVRVASPDIYRAAGLDYQSVLTGTRAIVLQRPDGRTVLRLTSDRAVQEPFVDVILELTWASGRLVREYTLLLDPPRIQPAPPAVAAAPAPAAPVVTAPVRPVTPPSAPPPSAATAPVAPRPAPPAVAAAPAPAPAAAAAPRPSTAAAGGEQVTVQRGDTLSRIAARTALQGVSLEQMLVSLYRSNPQAFIENNMNLLKAGSVLTVPAADAASQLSRDEALQVIRAQSADFNAYRQRLAGLAPEVHREEPARTATGTLQAAVEDRQPAATASSRLELSQGTVQPSSPEARASREAEQQATSTRVAELSRNVSDLERLEQAARADAAAPAASPVAAAAAPAEAASPAPAAPAVIVPAVPPVVTAPPPPAPAPADEPDFVTSLLDNPMVLPGAGALVALLLGLGIYRMRRGKVQVDSGETSFAESKSPADSFFGATGGQRVDTREAAATGAASSMSYSLSQLDAIGDVDPVAEADVYLAYGRDLQAEEILKEAMRANPERLAIRTKLLEVYAKRRDTKGFELLALQLQAMTRGEGEDWLKAQELGRQIDPDNPLYRAGSAPPPGATPAAAALGVSTIAMSVLPSSTGYGALQSRQPIEPLPAMGSDVDLDLGAPAPDAEPSAPVPFMEATQPMAPSAGLAPDSQLDFELPLDETPAATAPEFDFGGLSLDLDTPAAPSAAAAPAAPAADAEPPMLDFGSIVGGKPVEWGESTSGDETLDPLERKLELADEFRQIGDVEGARDLLEEVIARGGETLKAKAQAMLDRLV
jgi:pilus assembly protein FimV